MRFGLTLKEALKGHEEMWAWINKWPVDQNRNVGSLKNAYCREKRLSLLNHCWLCEYAAQQHAFSIPKDESSNFCEYCPIDWCKTCVLDCTGRTCRYRCECMMLENSSDSVLRSSHHWSMGNREAMLHLVVKDGLLK